MHDLLLIGGGHAHALVLHHWAASPDPGIRITLVDPNDEAPYTGMLPGLIAGHYPRDEMMIDLRRLAARAGAEIRRDRVVALDRIGGRARLQDGDWLRYDVASLDIGIGSGLPGLPGFDRYGVAARPLGDYAGRWAAFLADCPQRPQVVIIGAGVGGAELAMASAHRLRAMGSRPQVTLLERGPRILPGLPGGARRRMLAALTAQGVDLRCNAVPARLAPQAVHLADGTEIASDFTVSVAGARPQGWLTETGLALDAGFVTVSPQLRSSDPRIFAVGDCAHMAHAPRPKAGVFAVRQAPVLAQNLRAALTGSGDLRRYDPQRDYLKLISLGGKAALAERGGIVLQGGWLWRLKDRIDRGFMAQFRD
ncbi:FAD-dependent oxidoreductase [Szabonella alba]|uniref:FAD-dependent oxidoreductase n=1 Tax=Szabonella alba TaxID=2804194 RepID=A0A8K0VFP2_9RHOB|nr:FAD-dependent oxidoreductase [Szabonella alba]MBL4918809.1 FAD-dependent oxidoreductase [Szabonella alba]